jgi:hypothetical protein
MPNLTMGVKTPIELTVLRNKIASGARVTVWEAQRACELEKWLTRTANDVANARANGHDPDVPTYGGSNAVG